ncbi:hypothetical protein ABW20_dc0105566 [Dactylellina cionopaga]|nr:hypothetical protein ABW20_dc0105566 [Dactylellina cionopaga]
MKTLKGLLLSALYARVVIGTSSGSDSSSPQLVKRMHSAANYYGSFLLVTETYYSGWITKYSSNLKFFLRYSSEIRERLAELDKEAHISKLKHYARKYSLEMEGNEQLEVLPWQKFIDHEVLKTLQRPWEDLWEMPSAGLGPISRIQGLSDAMLKTGYPLEEIKSEEEFAERGPLLDDKISTVEYLREFVLLFPNTRELANWLFNPQYLPAAAGSEQTTGPYLELSRRERLETSFSAIYGRLNHMVEELSGIGSGFAGEIVVVAPFAWDILKDLEVLVQKWERIKDIIGVMTSIIAVLKEDPT